MTFETILKGGRVVDPAAGTETLADVGITGRTIGAIAPGLTAEAGTRVIDVTGSLVTPGLIDFHVHVFEGVCQIAIHPDRVGVQTGVTTVVDGGSSGAITFGAFRRWLMEPATTRVLCFLNMGITGIVRTLLGEMAEEGCYDPDLAARVIEDNRDRIVGIKVRATGRNLGRVGLAGLRRAKKLAREVRLPLLVHIGEGRDYTERPPFTVSEVLDVLEPGDILTHIFTARVGGLFSSDARALPALRAALERRVGFDVGHGRNNFSLDVYRKLLDEGVQDFVIGSDVNLGCVNGPVFDLTTTMTKLLALGLAPLDVLRRVTVGPARLLGREPELSRLRVGGEADITVLDVRETRGALPDTEGETIPVTRRFEPRLVLRAGRPSPCFSLGPWRGEA